MELCQICGDLQEKERICNRCGKKVCLDCGKRFGKEIICQKCVDAGRELPEINWR